MLKQCFENMLRLMKDYVAAKATHAEKMGDIDKMLQYSEMKKGELREEQRENFRIRKEKLIASFTEQINRLPRKLIYP